MKPEIMLDLLFKYGKGNLSQIIEMKIIFFAPHAAVWIHAFPESLVAEALAQYGHEIVYISCGQVFESHCVAMSAFGVVPQSSRKNRINVCKICMKNADFIQKKNHFLGYNLNTVLSEQDLIDIANILNNVTLDNFQNIIVDGIEVGLSALSSFLLSQKIIDYNHIPPRKWNIFKNELQNTLLSFYSARKILKREQPDRLMVYSSTYSVNYVWCQLADAYGIPFYTMNASGNYSGRLQKILLTRFHWFSQYLPSYWYKFRNIPCSPDIISYNYKHILALFESRLPFIYSHPKNPKRESIRKIFNINSEQKILLCTMSSFDEIIAAQSCKLLPESMNLLFSNQVEWIRALFDYMSSRPDLFLIVRPHPREFPNKRDNVVSQHSKLLEHALLNLPHNVAVNWPSQNLSLYDIAEEIDVCLNAWSSICEELGLLGIPVVTYAPELANIPIELALHGSTKEEYFQNIENVLSSGWSIEYCRMFNRWAALKYTYSRLDISDSYHFIENQPSSNFFATRLKKRILNFLDPLHNQKKDFNCKAQKLSVSPIINSIVTQECNSVLDIFDINCLPKIPLDDETLAIRNNFKYILNFLQLSQGGINTPLHDRLLKEYNLSCNELM